MTRADLEQRYAALLKTLNQYAEINPVAVEWIWYRTEQLLKQ